MDTYHDDLVAQLRGMYITTQPDVARAERLAAKLDAPKAHEVELYQDLEYAIDLLERYRRGDLRYLNKSADVVRIIDLLRNYRREKFGNPITDKERQA